MHITVGGIVFLVLIVFVILAIILIKNWKNKGSFSFAPVKFWEKKEEAARHNTLIIDRNRGIYTKYLDESKTEGLIPQIYRNQNRDMYVIISEADETAAYYPNDTTLFYSPQEWANVLKMDANEQLFRKRTSIFQNVHVWALVVAMVILAVLIIIF